MKKKIKVIVSTCAVAALTVGFCFFGCKADQIDGEPVLVEETTSVVTTITTEETTVTTTSVVTTNETTSITTEKTTSETSEITTEEIKNETVEEIKVPGTEAPVVEETVSTEPIIRTEEDYDKVAKEVWNGSWGSGSDRKARLEAAGYDYEKVQEKVNETKPVSNITVNTNEVTSSSSSVYLSDTEKMYLAVMLCHECSPRAGASHNAHSVAAMVNRVNAGNSSSIYNAISSSCCPWWPYGHGSWCMDNGCYDGMDSTYAYEAIEYYLNNSSSYSWVTGWYAAGDGVYNVYH